MKTKKQILIIICGIAIAILLVLSNAKTENWKADGTSTTQKKPKQNTSALFDLFL